MKVTFQVNTLALKQTQVKVGETASDYEKVSETLK